jgi:hypothetical protein
MLQLRKSFVNAELSTHNADKPQPKKINTEKTKQTERELSSAFNLCLLCSLRVEIFAFLAKISLITGYARFSDKLKTGASSRRP